MSLSATDLASIRLFISDVGSSEQQSLSVSATGGTYTLSYSGQTTSPIAYNAVAGVIQNSLTALSSIGLGNVTVSSSTQYGGSPFRIQFQGVLAHIAVPVIVADGTNLTGTNTSATVSEVTIGGLTAFTDAEIQANSDLSEGRLFSTVHYCILMLLSDSAKFNTYSIGQVKENKSEIFDHLKELADLYLAKAVATSQATIAGAIPVPPRYQPRPYQPGTTLRSNPNPWNKNQTNDGW